MACSLTVLPVGAETNAEAAMGPSHAGLATVEEGRFIDGRWSASRALAGVDTDQGNSVSLRLGLGSGIVRATLYQYQ